MDWWQWLTFALWIALWLSAEVRLHLVRSMVAETVDLWRAELRRVDKFARTRALTGMAANLESVVGICEPGQSEGLKLAAQICRNWAAPRDDDMPAVDETSAL